mmetsp:Transcript_21691/g.39805  ORF Transcript_21691/g.39805 Transcript_21691/m.39805 type:complete len:251 (-) Transcript_21691:28-780(-)
MECCCSCIMVSKIVGARPPCAAGALRLAVPPARDRGRPAMRRSNELGLETSFSSGCPLGVFCGDRGGVAGGRCFLGECLVCCRAFILCSSLYRSEFFPNLTHNSSCILDATLTSTAGHNVAAKESNLELDPSSDQVGLAIPSEGCTSLNKSSNVSSSSISLCLCSGLLAAWNLRKMASMDSSPSASSCSSFGCLVWRPFLPFFDAFAEASPSRTVSTSRLSGSRLAATTLLFGAASGASPRSSATISGGI